VRIEGRWKEFDPVSVALKALLTNQCFRRQLLSSDTLGALASLSSKLPCVVGFQWLTSVILATQEAEIRRIAV
jgi:hypothetical protein